MIVTANIALLLVAVVLLTMPVFAIVSRGRPGDPDVATRPTTVILGRWIRDWVMWLIRPFERTLVASGSRRMRVNVLEPQSAWRRRRMSEEHHLTGGWSHPAGWMADILDGRVARARGLASRYGEFIDSILDRFAEVFSFVGLAVYLSVTPAGALAVTLAAGAPCW